MSDALTARPPGRAEGLPPYRAEHIRRLLMVLPAFGLMSYRRAGHEAGLSAAATFGAWRDLLALGWAVNGEGGALELTDAGRAERGRLV